MEVVQVRMTVRWSVPPGEAQSITAVLHALMMQTRAEPGCVGCTLSTEMDGRALLRYIENWESEDDLRRQVQSDRFVTLAELIEQALENPVVEFALPDGILGLEYADRGPTDRDEVE